MSAHLAFYVSAHGLGHATRSRSVIGELLGRFRVTVVSSIEANFFGPPQSGLRGRCLAADVGMVQRDPIHVDLAASLEKNLDFLSGWERRRQAEREFLQAQGVDLVVSDSAALPLQAAADLGLPGLALASFGWHHIYQPYARSDPRWEPLVEACSRAYSRATALLQYPLSRPILEIQERIPVGLVARPGRRQALPGGAPRVLLALPGVDYDRDRAHSLSWTVLTPSFPGISFVDLVASVDVVLAKPGFGIVSDCLVHGCPLVFVPRPDFAESEWLEPAIQSQLPSARLSLEDFQRGNWLEALEKASSAPKTGPPPLDGGAVEIAQRIEQFLGRTRPG